MSFRALRVSFWAISARIESIWCWTCPTCMLKHKKRRQFARIQITSRQGERERKTFRFKHCFNVRFVENVHFKVFSYHSTIICHRHCRSVQKRTTSLSDFSIETFKLWNQSAHCNQKYNYHVACCHHWLSSATFAFRSVSHFVYRVCSAGSIVKAISFVIVARLARGRSLSRLRLAENLKFTKTL